MTLPPIRLWTPLTRSASPRQLRKAAAEHVKKGVTLTPPLRHVQGCTDATLATVHTSSASSKFQWSQTGTSVFAAMVPLAATAGSPIPGKVESPQQYSPGMGVAGPKSEANKAAHQTHIPRLTLSLVKSTREGESGAVLLILNSPRQA